MRRARWAARLIMERPESADEARITWLFECAFTRQPGPEERRIAIEALAELRSLYAGEQAAAVWPEFCHALVNANDFIFLK